jgi:hypothetical protein
MQHLEDKLQKAEEKEQRLMKLLYIIKSQGIPIEEIYEQQVSSTSSSSRPLQTPYNKPTIPKLDLETAENEESEDYEESEDDLFDSPEGFTG